jgi:tetratricopeptide (TPR) repeat protein
MLRAATRVAALGLLVASAAFAAGPDLDPAEQMIRDGRYQEASALLAPLTTAGQGDARLNYLAGRAALGLNQPDQAVALLERSVAADPESIPARLALGRAYFANGQFAEAKIEFETVFAFDNLPPDLESQARIYDDAAAKYLDTGERLTGFGYAEAGVGHYRVNSTVATVGGERSEYFFNTNVGGGLNYLLPEGYVLDASIDYEFRTYEEADSRNDSDLYWRGGISRPLGEDNLRFGVRGRVSYRGDGAYRNDYGVLAQYRHRIDADNQLAFGAELRRRRYPDGRLRERTRSSADASVRWIRSLWGGSGSFSVTGHGGQHFNTSRPDGDSTFWGATVALDFTLTESLGGFVFGWYERDQFNIDRIRFHPDAVDNAPVSSRKDDLYEVGAGLVWDFAPGWSLRPEILYIKDDSNEFFENYSSTEMWVNLRRSF